MHHYYRYVAKIPGSYTHEDARRDLPKLLEAAGLPSTLSKEARLLHYGHNAIFSLPGGMVMRNARPGPLAAKRTRKVAELGRHFRLVDADTVRLVQGFPEPIQVGELWSTIWMREERRPPEEVSGHDLAASLKKFHAMDIDSPALAAFPRWKDPLSDTKDRVRQGHNKGFIAENEYEFFSEWIIRLDQMIEVVRPELESEFVLVHGDAQVANILFREGKPILCDFDSTDVGPLQIDLATIAVSAIRFDKPERHQQAVTTYGVDATSDPHWDLFRQLREIKLVTAVIPELGDHPALRQEFDKRCHCVRSGDTATWQTYADAKNDYDEHNPGWRRRRHGVVSRSQPAATRRDPPGSRPTASDRRK